MNKWTVVLTGGIGSGKSAVAGEFEKRGVRTIDQDTVSREVVEPGTSALSQIRERFGARILLQDGKLDRAALRQRVFEDEEQRRWLERLLHPLIGQQTVAHIQEAKSTYAMVINPLLRNRQRLYQRVLVVDAPVETQIARTMKRDGVTEKLARSMVEAQIERTERLSLADDIIVNDSDLNSLLPQIEVLHDRYLSFAESFSRQTLNA